MIESCPVPECKIIPSVEARLLLNGGPRDSVPRLAAKLGIEPRAQSGRTYLWSLDEIAAAIGGTRVPRETGWWIPSAVAAQICGYSTAKQFASAVTAGLPSGITISSTENFAVKAGVLYRLDDVAALAKYRRDKGLHATSGLPQAGPEPAPPPVAVTAVMHAAFAKMKDRLASAYAARHGLSSASLAPDCLSAIGVKSVEDMVALPRAIGGDFSDD